MAVVCKHRRRKQNRPGTVKIYFDDISISDKADKDYVYIKALSVAVIKGFASASYIRVRCRVPYICACKIFKWMMQAGYVAPFDEGEDKDLSHFRRVLITREEFETKYGPLSRYDGKYHD